MSVATVAKIIVLSMKNGFFVGGCIEINFVDNEPRVKKSLFRNIDRKRLGRYFYNLRKQLLFSYFMSWLTIRFSKWVETGRFFEDS